MLDKIEQVYGRLSGHQRLEVDGGINPETIGPCAVRGANLFVAGNNVFGSEDIPAAIRALREAVAAAGGGA
jgi:ribulose-phosphate 3-epimerase